MSETVWAKARGGTLFAEEQRFTQTWVWPAVLAAAAFAWGVFIYQIGMADQSDILGSNRVAAWLLLAIIGVFLPWFFWIMKLETIVHSDRLVIHYRPLHKREIAHSDVAACYARTYRPIREYGGWGIRYGGRGSMAFNVSGDQGVQLELKDGKRVLIGSLRADALARSICDAAGLGSGATEEKGRT